MKGEVSDLDKLVDYVSEKLHKMHTIFETKEGVQKVQDRIDQFANIETV